MTPLPRIKFWLEVVLGLISLGLTLLTLIYRAWIEGLTGLDPDAGSGALEWAIVAALLSATITFAALARHDWHVARDAEA
jgi:hypothetical protein